MRNKFLTVVISLIIATVSIWWTFFLTNNNISYKEVPVFNRDSTKTFLLAQLNNAEEVNGAKRSGADLGDFYTIDIMNKKKERIFKEQHGDIKTKDYANKEENFIPVLMYHSINYEAGNELRVPKERFEEHVKWLKDNGFYTLSMKEFYEAITTGKRVPEKSILLTFDDGYKDNYTNGFPIMKKYKAKGTIFVITGTIDVSESYINSEEIKELSSNDIDIESHTVNHVELNGLNYEQQLKELKDSKEKIDRLLNKNTIAICYPVGKLNEDTIKAAEVAGYKVGFTTKSGYSNISQGLYKLKRVRINASTTVEQLQNILSDYK
ncbi:peptidoglycan/xylan/chitin deacetylase (PgdA/CDA1 family) [Clostridium punense]|uniref:Peptidoglycan/xylan/chitin deacetylase (PgdA/CDA1 family) n=1 Tax=Clostridium punense TaxID=1054297 RepID=A0ABS4K005_9CLOT|nr:MULTISPECIES: polysaccharide deacetylase family protein [Clostridium]EQB89132.1 hypothetical protein M918_21910 [Clostridium sp. BL8]MBP2021117.1 peptidoglycan/xylan/chitin deacetylase (PgdA/CDA1 family) [Clostridium punense]